ncbi:asparagine synthase (glutamine-hydrolyzing) [Microlunatus speluncae]|uniref:asparagine synthase (glutamine-hydrolyzing) n=1 Tax=Microlunatus speluncae TaxID=2594267 RepID=UPI001C2D632D|nr:asparagine synthase (glutamine-hydrolyzing) [Microlunatus speluncae]
MCGIVAIHRPNTSVILTDDLARGRRMVERVGHRGPDGQGQRIVGPTFLGHTRLAIVDLAEGQQPLPAPGDRWLVANGEIYNHQAIRADHPDYPFRTRSDSEAIAALIGRDGVPAIARLWGMFAFVYAGPDGSVVAARDELGIKPLYWADVDGAVLFASELRAFDPELRPEVREFPPGHAWTAAGGLVRIRPQVGAPAVPADRAEARRLIRERLITAVRRRLMADIPVGVFLSGGLDSSLVAAIMARHADPAHGPVRSFAAGTVDSSDLAAARRVAEHLGLDHTERIYTADEALAVLPEVVASIESYEPSLVRSAIPNYLLAQTTARSVKVVLTGEGADELFAGYDHLRELDLDQLQAELERSVRGLHNLNLQRCDRVTMAFGLEARVPFLDLDLVALAESIPIGWRLPGRLGQEKALLREAFAGWLPDDLLWRVKEQFGDGSGMAALIRDHGHALDLPANWRAHRVSDLEAPRSREELAYQRLFADRLDGISEDVLGRFATA